MLLHDHGVEATDALPSKPSRPTERRLFHRYPAVLPAVLEAAGQSLPCRIADLSFGGAAIELDDRAPWLAWAQRAVLRSPQLAAGYPFAVVVRRIVGSRVYLAFHLDEAAGYELTLFLMNRPTELGGFSS